MAQTTQIPPKAAPSTPVAFSTADHKHAALFFESIVPLHSAQDVPTEVKYPFWAEITPATEKDVTIQAAVQGLAEVDLQNDIELARKYSLMARAMGFPPEQYSFADEFAAMDHGPWENLTFAELKRTLPVAIQGIKLRNELNITNAAVRNGLALFYTELFNKTGAWAIPILAWSNKIESNVPDGPDDTVTWILANVRMVETDSASWEQILEIRRDDRSIRELRNLRVFLGQNFSGKSRSYVQDVLEKKVDDYQTACKRHGFNLIADSFRALLDSKSLLGCAAVTAAAILSGEKKIADAAACVGVILETSKFILSLAKAKHDLTSFKRDHELAYLFRAREKLRNVGGQLDDEVPNETVAGD